MFTVNKLYFKAGSGLMWSLVSNKGAIWLNTVPHSLHLCVLSNWLWQTEDSYIQLCHTAQMFAVEILIGKHFQPFVTQIIGTLNLCWNTLQEKKVPQCELRWTFSKSRLSDARRALCVVTVTQSVCYLSNSSLENVSLWCKFTLSSFQLTLKHSSHSDMLTEASKVTFSE